MTTGIVWLRRDLRLEDNAAIFAAARAHDGVCLAFVLSPPLLASERLGAPLVTAFFSGLASLREELQALGSDLALLRGDFAAELEAFARRIGARAVHFSEDYEPEAIVRDGRVTASLQAAGIEVRAYLDHAYFGAGEVVREDGSPYRMFTPYKRRWLDRRAELPRAAFASRRALAGRLVPREHIGPTQAVPAPEEFGFEVRPGFARISERDARERLKRFVSPDGAVVRYAAERNVPSLDATSRLSPHLRAGTIGIRACVERAFALRNKVEPSARSGIDAWIGELIWRDFYQAILRHFPHVSTTPFLPVGAAIEWRDAPADFAAWCEGRTGYPLVDAAMRQLATQGWMHNRLRMVAASFLCKHLLIDWRQGERFFERHLSDAELGSNNGGWQWCASVGTDAQPYIRIFNPVKQSQTFDPQGDFIRRYVPEQSGVPAPAIHEPAPLQAPGYPPPIVDHRFARDRFIRAFSSAAAAVS